MTKGEGQYDLEYAQCPCFWGTTPGKFVLLLSEHLSSGRVLDLGAGEGKNAIYLAERGFHVTAIDCSDYAIRNFRRRMDQTPTEVCERITLVHGNVMDTDLPTEIDAVVSYGLLHCLSSRDACNWLIERMQKLTRSGGWNVIATFTNELPVPNVQKYLEPTLIEPDFLRRCYAEWDILEYENAVLVESHPTTSEVHEHSICRMIARKPLAG